jgi:hypothetical protein
MSATITDWTKSPTNPNELHAVINGEATEYFALLRRKDKYYDFFVDGMQENPERLTLKAAKEFAEQYVAHVALAKVFVDGCFARPITERSEAIASIRTLAAEPLTVVRLDESDESDEPLLQISRDRLLSMPPTALPMYLGQPRITDEHLNGSNTEPTPETPAMSGHVH